MYNKLFKFDRDGKIIDYQGWKTHQWPAALSIYEGLPFLLTEKNTISSLKRGETLSYPLVRTSFFGVEGNYNLSFSRRGAFFLCWVKKAENMVKLQQLIQERNDALINLEHKTEETRKSRQLADSNSQLIQQNALLKQNEENKDQILSILSHDLKKPTNNILTMLNLLIGQKVSFEEFKALAPDLLKQTQNSRTIIEELLTWAQAQLNERPTQPQGFKPYEVAEGLISMNSTRISKKQIAVYNNICVNTSAVWDIDIFKLVVRNIFDNAIKYTRQEGKITFSSETLENRVWISVTDNGIGMTNSQLNQLNFGKAQKSTEGTLNEKGNGIGMKLVNDILLKNGGELNVSSKKGIGTTIKFSFPAPRGIQT